MAEASRSIPKQCAGTRKDGRPCTARVMGAGDYCFAHDPARETERRAAREQGGRNKRTAARVDKLVPATLRPTLGTLLAAVDEVKDGSLTPGQASAMASLAGAIVRLYQTGVLEERIAGLEAVQEQADTRRGA